MTHTPHPPPISPVTPREFRIVFAGLMLALALAALDQNIVSTALPQIVSDLHGLEHLSWVVTAFLLTSTTTAPLYGKFSDMFGRKPLFIIAIVIFLVGSALCGVSQTMTQLIIYRGIQGLGAGGLITLAQTTIADMVTPRERGRYQGLIGGVFAICSVAGPLLGGFLTTNLSWRWIFYVNIPIGIPALGLIAFGLRRHNRAVIHSIDYLGAFLLTGGTTCLLVMLSWGGSVYAWSSFRVVALGLVSVACWLVLAWWERRTREPVLPPRLFKNNVFVSAIIIMSLTFMAMLGAAVFLPTYFQIVLGCSPRDAGLMMAPLMVGIITASIVGGRLVSKTGRYKQYPVIGLAFASIAYLVIGWNAMTAGPVAVIEVSLVFLGLGIGMVMPILIVAIQNAVDRADMGAATAATSFFRSLGGSLGVALSGAIMTIQLHSLLPNVGGAGAEHSVLDQSLKEIAALPPDQHAQVISAFRHAISSVFITGAAIAGVGFFFSLFLPERPLRSHHETPDATAPKTAELEPEPQPTHLVE